MWQRLTKTYIRSSQSDHLVTVALLSASLPQQCTGERWRLLPSQTDGGNPMRKSSFGERKSVSFFNGVEAGFKVSDQTSAPDDRNWVCVW